MPYLQQCAQNIRDQANFPNNWFNGINFQEPDLVSSFTNRATNTTINLIEALNKAIIAGEYIDFLGTHGLTNTLISLINEIVNEADSIVTATVEESDLKLQISNTILNVFSEPTIKCCKTYQAFVAKIKNDYLHEDVNFLFEAVKKSQSANSVVINRLTRTLLLNTWVAKIDHKLSINTETLKQLLQIRLELKETSTVHPFVDPIVDKTNYLIKKILYRLRKDREVSYQYTLEYQEIILDLESFDTINFYKGFDELTNTHYEIGTTQYIQRQKRRADEAEEKIRMQLPLSFKDYHALTKVYKDHYKNPNQLRNLLDAFLINYEHRMGQPNLTLFDKRALHSSYNYIYNNYFSSTLEQSDLPIEEIELIIKDIEALQNITGQKNYFPFYKMSKYLSEKIDSLFNIENIDYKVISALLAKLETYLELTHKNMEWCKERSFSAFQLPYQECCSSLQLNTTMFLSSSFVLPINYDKVEIELKEISRKMYRFKTLKEVDQTLSKDKETIQQIKRDLEKSDRRSIEILAVFSAVVLFTSGNIQIFNIAGITFERALKFMLSFSYSLVLFVFLIWLITRENPSKIHPIHVGFFILLSVISLGSFLFIIKCWPFGQ